VPCLALGRPVGSLFTSFNSLVDQICRGSCGKSGERERVVLDIGEHGPRLCCERLLNVFRTRLGANRADGRGSDSRHPVILSALALLSWG